MYEYSSPCTDEPLAANPRVHVEGREYYERNHKSSDWFGHENQPNSPEPRPESKTRAGHKSSDWFGHDSTVSAPDHNAEARPHSNHKAADWFTHDSNTNSTKPEARLRSEAARENAAKNRGSMADNLQGYANPPMVRTLHPRGVKGGDAREIAEGNKGDGMRKLIEDYGNLEVSPRPVPKVKGSDAEEYLQRQQGSTKVLLDHYSTDPIPASELPPKQRLGIGAEEIAEKHKGERMGPLMRLEGTKTPREPKMGRLHQQSSNSGWDEIPPKQRMRPEGETIAQKNSSDSINGIFQNNHEPPHVKTPTKNLQHMAESSTPRKTPPSRVRLDGLRNMEKARNQEEMSAIMHGSPSQHKRPDSGKKILPHLQRSELW